MSDSTRQGLIWLVALVIAFLAVLYGTALYQGKASMDPILQTALIGLIVAGTGFVTVAMQTRQARQTRDHSDQNAAETRERVAGTEEKVTTLIARVEDGLGGKIAEIVKGDAEKVAEALRIKVMEEENIALKAKLEALQTVYVAPVAPQLVLPNGQAVPDPMLASIDANTRDTAAAVAEVAVNTAPEGKT